jgi:mRNA interferase MazF
MVTAYIPDIGDVVWLDFDPQAGHEQAGRQPVVVLSPKAYNGRTGLCLAVPVTNQSKGYPFELPLPGGCKTKGVVLCDQIRSLDWFARQASLKESAGADFARNVLARFLPLVIW